MLSRGLRKKWGEYLIRRLRRLHGLEGNIIFDPQITHGILGTYIK